MKILNKCKKVEEINEANINKTIKTNKKNISKILLEKILEILRNNIIFILGTMLLVYKALLLNYLLHLQIKIDVILYTIVVSLLIMAPSINKKNKFTYIYLNIIYTIITILIYANFLYYNYSTNFLSFYQIENIKYAKEIGSGILCIITIKSIFTFWFDNILVSILSIITYSKFKETCYNNKILKILLILIILFINIIVIRERIENIYKSESYNKSLIVQNASIYYYHYEDAKDYFYSMFIKEDIDKEKLKNAYNENINQKENSSEYTATANNSNVIILQLESLNEYIIGKKVNGKEITPNLNKFFSTNIYCNAMYNQGLGTTADSEFEMENSMYPLENGYVFQKYYSNTWLDIFTELRNNGYYTSFMHPNTSTFWNREEMYKTGYNINEYNDINRFPNIENAGEFYSDEEFFEEAINIINSYEEKFCTTLVSVTTHIPFYLTGISNLENKITITSEDLKEYEDETFKNYLISCNFVDYAFGNLLKKLEETGLMKKSIFIVYGDHGAGLNSTNDIRKLYNENEIEYTEFENIIKDIHIPFGIKIPGINKNYNIERSVSKIDIKPTILDLLGIEDNFSIGTTIFSGKDYSFIKGLGYVTSKNYYINGKYYNKKTSKEIDETEELKIILQKMQNEIYLSDTIIRNNLFARKGDDSLFR